MPRTQPDAPACRSAVKIGPGKRRAGACAPVRLTEKTLFTPQVFG